MAISLNASTLIIGTLSGFIHLYDIASHQLLRSISTHKGLVITHLVTMLKPPDLTGHISLNLNTASAVSAKDVMPTRPVAPFQRVRDAKARNAHEVLMMLPTSVNVRFLFLFEVIFHLKRSSSSSITSASESTLDLHC